LIVDAQSVKNTDSARHKGYDAGKKVSGIKRHIAVDTLGLPHAIAVTTANATDRAQALKRCSEDLQTVRSILADGGYTGEPFACAVKQLIGAQVQVAKNP
jgi:transposase